MEEIKVEKKDGRVEFWSYDKVLLSIEKAMIPLKKAEELASGIEKWAKKQAKKGVITSAEIRDKVITLLSQADPVAAESYRLFKKGD